MLCHSRLYTHLIAGLLIGVLFLDIGGDAAHVFHNFSLLFFCLMFLMFTALSAMILACEYLPCIKLYHGGTVPSAHSRCISERNVGLSFPSENKHAPSSQATQRAHLASVKHA